MRPILMVVDKCDVQLREILTLLFFIYWEYLKKVNANDELIRLVNSFLQWIFNTLLYANDRTWSVLIFHKRFMWSALKSVNTKHALFKWIISFYNIISSYKQIPSIVRYCSFLVDIRQWILNRQRKSEH